MSKNFENSEKINEILKGFKPAEKVAIKMLSLGYKQTVIAKRIGRSDATISGWLKREDIREAIDKLIELYTRDIDENLKVLREYEPEVNLRVMQHAMAGRSSYYEYYRDLIGKPYIKKQISVGTTPEDYEEAIERIRKKTKKDNE